MMILKNKLCGSASSARQGLSDPTVFVRDYARSICRFYFWNDDVCFFVWIFEMEQFKLKVERCSALLFNQKWGCLICLLQGAAIFD